jgi:phage gpG-like protein
MNVVYWWMLESTLVLTTSGAERLELLQPAVYAGTVLSKIKKRNLHTWLGGYSKFLLRRTWEQPFPGTKHLLFAFCDHYEPLWGKASDDVGQQRVDYWHKHYPEMAKDYCDADGKGPQHSFFFPIEEFRPSYFDKLTDLVKQGAGEVELHMHFDGWNEAKLRSEIIRGTKLFADYGHFSRTPEGAIQYAFIHGNWALSNGRPDGKHSGVDAELPILFETGCYADFTFPAAPDVCQPNIVNQIYWPTGNLAEKRAYENGEEAEVGRRYRDRLLMIEGPLALARKPNKLSGKIENGAVTAVDPANADRVKTWVDQNIHIKGRPEWVFVKVYTHGAPEKQAGSLLHDGGHSLHRALTSHYNDGKDWVLHYVSAREMYNIAMAAMDGKVGNPNDYRDYNLPPPPVKSNS